jgi:predicted NAD/FAD-binding protein
MAAMAGNPEQALARGGWVKLIGGASNQDLAAIEAQKRLPLLQGQQHTWYAGAWTGYGFHEDGLKSGLQVGQSLLKRSQDQGSTAQDRWAA